MPRFNPEEALYLTRTSWALFFAVLGIILTRTLTRPLQALTQAARSIAAGQLEQQVQVTSKDEIGQLAAAFNKMSQEVVRVNQQRRQMTADIAHDLRTPLTVIAGYIESMRDGVLQPTPERLSLIYNEIEGLQNLVGDLRMLSQMDSGELTLHLQQIPPQSLLDRAAASFQHRAEQQNVVLSVQAEENLPDISVDESRMMQVFGNLLSNSLRYTPAGNSITLSAQQQAKNVVLAVRDTGAGIVEEDLPYIFDRFQRADKSRHTESGESGLGLSIVKALIEAQGGKVWAESKDGEGTSIYLSMPVDEIHS